MQGGVTTQGVYACRGCYHAGGWQRGREHDHAASHAKAFDMVPVVSRAEWEQLLVVAPDSDGIM